MCPLRVYPLPKIDGLCFGLHKIFLHSKAFLHQSIILLLPPPSALLTRLQYYCTSDVQYTTPHPTPLVVAIHYTILAMAISCKGQVMLPSLPDRRVLDSTPIAGPCLADTNSFSGFFVIKVPGIRGSTFVCFPKKLTRVAAPSPRASLGRRTVCGRTEQLSAAGFEALRN